MEELSLRGIARSAGVSHAAPYHHFKDVNALLAAVAASGFIRLRQAMLERAHSSGREPLRRLQEAGIAYVDFAVRHPELYRLMFSGRLRAYRDDPELSEASSAAYGALGELLLRSRSDQDGDADSSAGRANLQADDSLNAAATAAWSLVHGHAMLLIDGRLEVDSGDPSEVAESAREVTGILGRGLRSF